MKGRALMNNKKKTAFLSLALAAGLLLGACQPSSTSSSSSSTGDNSSSSSEVLNKYTVTFKVEGVVVQTITVTEGDYAYYTGATPTKDPDSEAFKYRFAGWDQDINQPIRQDMEFNAVFSGYVYEAMVDDFESYENTPTMLDAGWQALGYDNTSKVWNDATKAAVSLGYNSVEGSKSLRFDAWENSVGYKIAKKFEPNTFTKACNALQFRLMAPSINILKVIVEAKVTIQGQEAAPRFTYTTKPVSSDFVDYIIPLADDGWALWGEAGKSIHSVAEWTGFHEDDILLYLTAIEFYLEGSTSGNSAYIAYLDSVRFVTLDEPTNTQTHEVTPFSTYTGTTASGEIVRVTINSDNSATAKVVTLKEPITIPGHVSYQGKNMTFTSSDNGESLVYEVALTDGGQLGKYISASGTFKDEVEDMNIKSVQIVDNFEQYTEDGKAYYTGNTDIDARSGARGAYYSEYYTDDINTSSPWGGTKWSLMGGNGDQLKLKQDAGAHSGNQYLCLKNSSSKAMRYMQWDLFADTAEKHAYRGTTMGFWAKTNGVVKKFIVYMYSQTSPTNDTRDTNVRKVTFEETEAINEWKHYEVALNPDLVYYGYMITLEPNYLADSYLYIDDVEVYTSNPYAVYVPPAPAIQLTPNMEYLGKSKGLFNAHLVTKENNEVQLSIPALGIDETGTLHMENYDTTLTFDDVTYSSVVSEDGKTFTFTNIEGTGAVTEALNNVNFNMVQYAENVETYTEGGAMYSENNQDEANIRGAAGAYYCDAYNGGEKSSPIGGQGWQLYADSSDPIRLDTANYVDGKQSIQFKNNRYASMRFLQWDLYKGTASAHTGVDKFTIYLKNPSSRTVYVNVMVYKVQKVTYETQGESYRVETGTLTFSGVTDWQAYTIDLDPNETYYGFGLMFEKSPSTASWLNVDLAYFSGPDSDSTIDYYAEKDMTLSGTTSFGDASFKFDDNGKVYLTYASLDKDNVLGQYAMEMSADTQVMTIKVANTVIKGTYAVNATTGQVTFTVTETTGDLAANFPVSTAFTNQ